MAKAWAQKFYKSKVWKQQREFVLMRDTYICQECKAAPAEEVHHLKHLTPGNINDYNIALNEKNLVSLCRECHFKQHKHKRAEDVAEGYEFDEEGQVIPIKG